MAPKNKNSSAEGWESVPDSVDTAGWEPVEETTAPVDSFAATKENKEGTYRMQSPSGKIVSVPYSKVMPASKAGYLISSADRMTYGKDKIAELQGKGQRGTFHPETDIPRSFTEVGAATPWYKTGKGWLRAGLDVLPTAGGVVGGILGAGAGLETGPGAIATGAAGAAAGGGLGEDVRQALTEEFFPLDSRMTPKESAEAMGKQAAAQGTLEAGGRVAGLALRPATKYFEKTALATKASGIPLLPSEAVHEDPSFLEKLAKGHVFSEGQMKNFRIAQNEKAQNAVEKLANDITKFTGSREQLGEMVQTGIETHKKAFREAQDAAYKAIEKKVGERTIRTPVYGQIDTGLVDAAGKPIVKTQITGYEDRVVDNVMPSRAKIVQFAQKALSDIEAGRSAAGKAPASRFQTLLEGIIDNSASNSTYRGMREARSEWLSLARDLNAGLSGKEAGLIKKMASLADESIADAAQKSKIPGLLDEMRQADQMTADEHKMFEQDLVNRVVSTKKPEVMATLLRGRKVTDTAVGTGLQETRDIMKLIPEKMHPQVQRQILLDTMRQSMNLRTKLFNERRFAEAIENIGDDRGKVIFGANWDNIKKLTDVLKQINGPLGLGGGSGAALQNIGAVRGIAEATYLAPLALVAGGHIPSGVTTAASEFAFVKGLATTLTHPEGTAKLLRAIQTAFRIGPYVAAGVGFETRDIGRKHEGKAPSLMRDVREKGQELKDRFTKPSAAQAPTHTHFYDEQSDQILPVQ